MPVCLPTTIHRAVQVHLQPEQRHRQHLESGQWLQWVSVQIYVLLPGRVRGLRHQGTHINRLGMHLVNKRLRTRYTSGYSGAIYKSNIPIHVLYFKLLMGRVPHLVITSVYDFNKDTFVLSLLTFYFIFKYLAWWKK